MTEPDWDALITQYAAGEITCSRGRVFENCVDVLARLGKLGFRPPVAPMEGPNVEIRAWARASARSAYGCEAVTKQLGLIVTDASPLITLGAARASPALQFPPWRVFIPDMVYTEVTRDMAKLGADEVVVWVSRASRAGANRPDTGLCRV